MNKFYIIVCGLLISGMTFAQSLEQNLPKLKQFTKDQISPIVGERGSVIVSDYMRENILEEDFEVGAPDLPEGWATNEVTSDPDGPLAGALTPAYVVGDAALANNGGYWPVPEPVPGNNFALANDDGPPCDCDMGSAILTMPALDFTDVVNAALSFDIFHDQGFGGGDASLEISLDEGGSWEIVIEALPVDESVWQTIIVPLYDFGGEASITLRWNWTDAGSWASGFAVDNVAVGELSDYNLKADKVVFGDWDLPEVQAGLYNFSMIPPSQLSEVNATAVISNNGFLDQENVSFDLEIFEDGASVGTYSSAMVVATLPSLNKDTLNVLTGYVPSGSAGEVSITMTTTSDSGDEVAEDDNASSSFMVSDLYYARDADAAQAFVDPGAGYEYGNLFDIYEDVMVGGVSFAVGAGSEVGATFNARVYEFMGFDENGDPMLEDIGLETQDHVVLDADLNGVAGNVFVDLPFFGGAQTLEAGKSYLANVVTFGGSDLIRTPVSGSNTWPASLLFDGEWGWTLSIPMVRLNMNTAIDVQEEATASFNVQQNIPNPAVSNTRINYTMAQASVVSMTVTDISGRVVFAQDFGTQLAGPHVITLDVDQFNAGVYNYTISAGDQLVTKQMIVH